MGELSFGPADRALVLGATGFIGTRLVRELAGRNVSLRLFVRDPEAARLRVPCGEGCQVVRGDLVAGEGLEEAFAGIHTAYYLVHSMGGRSLGRNAEFARKDLQAVMNFVRAGEEHGLRRVIYLGGLGEMGDDLSEHLASRAEVGRILSSSSIPATILRAAVIIGAGGVSFEMLRYLVERLPVMVCPKWISTRIQPIALRDVLAYLIGALFEPATAGRVFDIGGPEVFTYREMMDQYAEVRGIAKRYIIEVPLLTPLLSAYWVDLVTPIPSGVAHPLIEGLRNTVVCREKSVETVMPIEKTPFREAVRLALEEESGRPLSIGG